MNFVTIDDIRHAGFIGEVTVSALQVSSCREVPDEPGVYLILRRDLAPPAFRPQGTGCEKYTNEKVSDLQGKWVEGTVVLNIGKAGGRDIAETLRDRLGKYMRFGKGRNSGHSGGRRIWQLRDSGDLLVCWKVTGRAVPREAETELIKQFEQRHGKLPFANARH